LSKAYRSSPKRLSQWKEGLQATNDAFQTLGDPFDINSDAVAEKKRVQENTQSSKRCLKQNSGGSANGQGATFPRRLLSDYSTQMRTCHQTYSVHAPP
jgi:hypothetical protein